MADFGGHIRLMLNGNPLVIRGKFETEDSDETFEGITNQNGSVSRSRKPEGFKWSATFEDVDNDGSATGQDWNAIMKGGPYNVTIPEDETNVLHTYTGCTLVGRPKVDRLNGEVTGIEGLSASYKRTTGA